MRDISKIFEQEKEDYYTPVTKGNFWIGSYNKYESNRDRNETLSVEDYRNKIKPYLKDIINNLKTSDTWKIQLTTASMQCI